MNHHYLKTKLRSKANLYTLVVGFLFLFFTGCMVGGEPARDSSSRTEVSKAKQALEIPGYVKTNDQALAIAFSASNDLTHGVAGDKKYIFYTEALNQRVSVISRLTGQLKGTLPAPPEGFLLPFSVRITGPGKLVVMDTGGFPSPTVLAIPRIYDYTYQKNPETGAFEATLVRTVKVENVPFGFAEDITVASDGSYFLSDSVLGAIWIIKTDGTYVQGVGPASLNPQDTIPQLGGCLFPAGVVVDGIPFTPPGGFSPGVGSMTTNSTHLFFGSSCGGLYKIPLSVFGDARLPHQRAADIVTVSPKPAGQLQDTLKGLNFNTYDSQDNKLYAVQSFQLKLVRIDINTGAREDVIGDAQLFNFPVAAQFLPPLLPGLPAPLIVSSDQEHRFPGINTAITENMFILPFRLTKVFLK